MGKALIPDEILNKPDRLDEEEFRIMSGHPVLGVNILKEQGHPLAPSAMRIVRHHHERVNGSGYPDHLAGTDLDPFVVICGMVDVYDALSSDRVYKKAMLPQKALKIVFSMRGEHFPAAWVDRFIYCLGIFPAGSVVRLNNNEVGVVTSVNHANLTRPVVRMIVAGDGRRMSFERVLDLNEPDHEKLEVQEVLDPHECGLDPSRYFPF